MRYFAFITVVRQENIRMTVTYTFTADTKGDVLNYMNDDVIKQYGNKFTIVSYGIEELGGK